MKGISISGDGMFSSHTVCAALLCFVSDIPATRKVCGFPGFKATLGCSKCLKIFPCEGFGEPTDYSDFDRHDWVARTMKNHLESLKEKEVATTLTEKTRLEKNMGLNIQNFVSCCTLTSLETMSLIPCTTCTSVLPNI